MSNPRKLSDVSLSSESSGSDTQDVLTGEPAPAYDDADHSKYHAEGAGFDSVAQVNSQGQVDLWLDLSKPLPPLPLIPPPSRKHTLEDAGQLDCPPLNIVIFVVGSRGDVQPYLALAIRLIERNGHRVRIATHSTFKDLVLGGNDLLKGKSDKLGPLEGRLEFFDVGGDPKELMAYMVKNPGLLPGFKTIFSGDISSKRKMTAAMLEGFYQSCFEPDPVSDRPFAASAIISNPPAFAHIHVAEALGLPLLMSFTMPWSPTGRFAHPLVNVKKTNADKAVTNYLSYAMAETLMWQGLGDIINDFRVSLHLKALSLLTGPMATERLNVPFTYAWSECLLPKPEEWKENNDIVGFFNLPGHPVEFKPDDDLAKFLEAGPAPIYIGFGSIVVKRPAALTQTIVEAVKRTGVRALVSAGWSGLGNDDIPEEIFLIKNDIPHDWLFSRGRVAAVCHHGGAGTTSAGLHAGLPTFIIPFFGDQRFWGTAVALAGAGPQPVRFKKLTVDKFAAAIEKLLSEPVQLAAKQIGEQLVKEDGTAKGVDSFHASLDIKALQCDLDSSSVAVWWCHKYYLRLSAKAAGAIVQQGLLRWRDLTPIRVKEYLTSRTYVDPVTASSQALLHVLTRPLTRTAEMVRAPRTGFAKAGWSMATASGDVLTEVHQGFENLPGMMGSRVRPQRRVSTWQEGLVEGVAGLGYGLMDGITGLVTEPMDGARRGGATGLAAGIAKAPLNLLLRPMSGMLGFVVHPSAGAYHSWRKHKSAGGPLRGPREEESTTAAAVLSEDQRMAIVSKYRSATTTSRVTSRRERLQKAREGEELDAAYYGLDDQQREELLARPWWEKILPPNLARPGSPGRSSKPSSTAPSPELVPVQALQPPPLPPRSPSPMPVGLTERPV